MLKNFKEGDWNAVEVIVTDTKAHCTCNGEILEASLEIPGKGPLALQSEINVLEYRNLRVKTSKQVPGARWRPLMTAQLTRCT